ncbi:DEAD/DEAH box helicase [Faecalibaculum rodentium]|uniref:DEAD/DEAH box helicase n=1 Tax=Faecalibaculum rodentium TaxID=1702221 RepID=UPI002730C184|nr:DEAD/DEAH box helicase [Faecalibaculum rodentium]
MQLRPYQEEAKQAIFEQWKQGNRKTLLVLATGLGKTIVFCSTIEQCVKEGQRALILAHRGELLTQAAEKLHKTTGLIASLEKAESSCLGDPARVVVGSVQTMQSDKRLARFPQNYFDVIVVDEAHHALSDGYQRVLEHFPDAKVLGVTATPDRGDKRNLGQYFDSIAYQYDIAQGIRDGYLSPIRALTVPLSIDLTDVSVQAGDYSSGDLGEALEPYLEQIADAMQEHCRGRKTIVFLPLVATSQKFRDILESRGFRAEEVNGTDSPESRKAKLHAFESGQLDVLCNSMLLTEGFDCPSIDCVICLRPTKVRSLYTQIVGRGTRLHPGKDYCLILDFLWHSERHELCHPAHLVSEDPAVQAKATEMMEEATEDEDPQMFDIEDLVVEAEKEVVAEREASLAKQLKEMSQRKSKFVDPLQWELSINTNELASYEETMPWEMKPITEKQKRALEKAGINPDEIDTNGKASLILNKLTKRRDAGLTTPKQIRFLEKRGFRKVGEWRFEEARGLIDRIAGNGWRIPADLYPVGDYKPASLSPRPYYSQSWENATW